MASGWLAVTLYLSHLHYLVGIEIGEELNFLNTAYLVKLTGDKMIGENLVTTGQGSNELLARLLRICIDAHIASLTIVTLTVPTAECYGCHLLRCYEIVIAESCHNLEVLNVCYLSYLLPQRYKEFIKYANFSASFFVKITSFF